MTQSLAQQNTLRIKQLIDGTHQFFSVNTHKTVFNTTGRWMLSKHRTCLLGPTKDQGSPQPGGATPAPLHGVSFRVAQFAVYAMKHTILTQNSEKTSLRRGLRAAHTKSRNAEGYSALPVVARAVKQQKKPSRDNNPTSTLIGAPDLVINEYSSGISRCHAAFFAH